MLERIVLNKKNSFKKTTGLRHQTRRKKNKKFCEETNVTKVVEQYSSPEIQWNSS